MHSKVDSSVGSHVDSNAAVDLTRRPFLDHNLVNVEVDFGLLSLSVSGHVVEAEPLERLHVPLRLVQFSFSHVLGREDALDGVVEVAAAPLALLGPSPPVAHSACCRRWLVVAVVDLGEGVGVGREVLGVAGLVVDVVGGVADAASSPTSSWGPSVRQVVLLLLGWLLVLLLLGLLSLVMLLLRSLVSLLLLLQHLRLPLLIRRLFLLRRMTVIQPGNIFGRVPLVDVTRYGPILLWFTFF